MKVKGRKHEVERAIWKTAGVESAEQRSYMASDVKHRPKHRVHLSMKLLVTVSYFRRKQPKLMECDMILLSMYSMSINRAALQTRSE